MLIGDVALRATLRGAPSGPRRCTDLGAVWREWTGLPMVFAVWAVRRDFAVAHPGLVKEVHAAFLRSRDVALAHLDEVADSGPLGALRRRDAGEVLPHARLPARRPPGRRAVRVRAPRSVGRRSGDGSDTGVR